MNRIEAHTDAIREYGNHAAAVSAELAHLGTFDLAENLASLTPVFGLVGSEFLAAFAAAQTQHAAGYAQLTAHFAATAQVARGTAAAYERTDRAAADALRGIGDQSS